MPEYTNSGYFGTKKHTDQSDYLFKIIVYDSMGASFLNLVATKVTVKGEEQKFVSLHLRQGFNRHHTFTVVVNYLSPNNTFQQTPEKFIGYIGETASISFVHRQTGESYDF